MKTVKNIFEKIYSFENLYYSFLKARRGKRYRDYAVDFEKNIEENLLNLAEELRNDTYKPGKYRTFHIFEPKKRLISAAPFRDRIVHHALINIIEPFYDPSFIEDTYACRKGKGTHAAIDRCQKFMRRYDWILKCDIRKYFHSIDHTILLNLLQKRIKDLNVLNLISIILNSFEQKESILEWFPGDNLLSPLERSRGLPIGNLTSQFFANLYLNDFDHFIKQDLRCKGYLRYMDDFILFGDTKAEMLNLKKEIVEYLSKIRLRLHPLKQEIFPSKNSISFLGFIILRSHRRLLPENISKFKNRIKRQISEIKSGNLSLSQFRHSLNSWIGHAKHGNTWKLRSFLFNSSLFKIN